ncbi:MAG: 4Fe-4S dicluster domain-containing protein, partial [Candidatus Eiseniibacteriota bacterium]
SGGNGHASGGNGHASGGNGLASGGNGLASGGNGLASAGNDALVAAGGESVAPIGRRDAAHMNRLYAIESMPTVTGTIADHRWALAASEIESLARDLALALRVPGVVGGRPGASNAHPWLRAVVDDLQKHPGRSLVVAGDTTSPEVHALVHAINVQLGNTGSTVHVTEPVEARPVLHHASLAELVGDMRAGNVDLLCIIGGNPVFDAPVDLDFAGALDQVGLRIHLGLYDDETAERCHWHVPAAHELESWSDARSHDGTASIVQPLIEPLYHGKSAHELLEALVEVARGEESTEPPLVPYDRLRDTWRRWHQARRAAADAGSATPGTAGAGNGSAGSTAIAADFDTFWRRALHDGLIPGTGSRPRQPRLDRDGVERAAQRIAERAATRRQRAAGTCELNLRLDPAVHDGSLANNGWMQELPRPWTRLTWDNAVLVSPAQASTLGVENGDVVQVTAGERAVQAPVWVLPGHAQGSVTLHLGYGRRRAGRVASGAGVDAYPLRTGDAPWLVDDVVLEPTGERRSLACTQDHNSMAGRDLIRSATIDTHRRDPHWAHAHAHEPAPDDSLYPNFDYDGYAWGMSIDLSACTGCNACVVACQAENNIPVVGKEQVLAAREMHWLRIDRYFQGDIDRPEIAQQPLLCQHCERAPCEPVCPVGATVHSSEGLNDMAYNRCVGTRYCSNNCPYKVRRFNFLQFTELRHTSVSLQRNPDVTVRTRGVMEKCTFCVQRINHARITAKTEGRRIQDGDIQTACQQVCPTQAILFGDQNDAGARVTAAKHDPLDYSLLGELNTRPRLTYLARLRNPNPALDGTHQETDRG